MRKMIAVLVMVGLALGGNSANATPAGADALTAQNPFEVIAQLTELSYAELAQMYPALSDVELRALRWRIVNHMQGLE